MKFDLTIFLLYTIYRTNCLQFDAPSWVYLSNFKLASKQSNFLENFNYKQSEEPLFLAPSAETYVFETGEVHQLLNLGGTIPIVYKQETYNIPIKVFDLPYTL